MSAVLEGMLIEAIVAPPIDERADIEAKSGIPLNQTLGFS